MGAETTAFGRPHTHSVETQLAFAPHSTPPPAPRQPPATRQDAELGRGLCSHFHL